MGVVSTPDPKAPMHQHPEEEEEEGEGERTPLIDYAGVDRSCWTRFRESKHLVLLLVCVLLMLDVMLITTLEPLLPLMLFELDRMAAGGLTWSAWAESLFSCGIQAGSDYGSRIGNGSGNASFERVPSEGALYARYAPQVGLILGLKPGVEVIGNLIVGPLVDRIGHKLPLLVGSVLYLVTACMFALSPNFSILIIARILQAASSSLSTVSGLALLASTFRNEDERSRASSIAFGGLSFGLIVGFPFGAVVAQFLGRASPFLILGGLSGLDAVLRLMVKSRPSQRPVAKESQDVRLLWRLATNRFIGSVLLANFFIHFGLGTIFTTIPTFMQDRLGGALWQMAVVTFVATALQFGTQFVCTGWLTRNPLQRWKFLFPSLIIFSLAQFAYPLIGSTKVIWFAVLPEAILRLALGIFTSTCFPTLNFLVDQFFNAEYGAINGLYTGVFNLGMFCGSQYAGLLFQSLGFDWLYYVSACVLLLAAALGFAHRQLLPAVGVNCTRLQQSVEEAKRRDSLGVLVHSSASGSVL